MILRGIRFGSVHQASGVTNFDGNGWWYHHPLRPFGLNFRGSTFVAKTTTLEARAGNMPLKKDGKTPKEWIPKSIIVKRKDRVALNAVSLSGPGLEFIIEQGWWQNQLRPFLVSVMSLEKTAEDRLYELKAIFEQLTAAYRYEKFLADWGVQVNLSCPNGGLDPHSLAEEALPVLNLADKTLSANIPVMLKFGPEVHPESMLKIGRHPRLDAICVFNTMPFGKQAQWTERTSPIDWKRLFGTDDPQKSPMAKRFPGFAGGLSGAPLLPLLIEWLERARKANFLKPICGGGGILCPEDAEKVSHAGADAVFLGSIAFLAPRQVRKTIRHGNVHFGTANGLFRPREHVLD